jgi:hypothetical protein
VDVGGCGILSVHDGLLVVAWFCVCKLGVSLAGDESKLGGGGWCKCVALHQVDTYVWMM